MSTSSAETPNDKPAKSGWWKLGIFTIFVATAAFLYWQFGSYLSLERLAEQETALRDYQAQNPTLVFGIAFLIYVTVTGMSLPGAAILTLVYGWYFGFWETLLLVSFASTLALEKEGPFYLFTLRLIPAVPFFIVNAVMGLTPLKPWTFWWISQLGMLGGTAVFVYAGSSVPDLATLAEKGVNAAFSPTQIAQITGAFVLMGLFPLVARFCIKLFKKSDPQESTA